MKVPVLRVRPALWLKLMGVAVIAGSMLLASLVMAAGLQFLEEPGAEDFDIVGTLLVKNAKALQAKLVFNYQANGQHYLFVFANGQAKLVAVNGKSVRPLGNPAKLVLANGTKLSFTVQRRAWRIALICDNKVVLRAYDRALHDGKVGSIVTGGAFEDLRIQQVGDIQVHDDFVRAEDEQSVWEPVNGTWEARTLRDDEQAAREEPEKSANAFSYFGKGEPHAISVCGEWFWDSYSYEAAVKPTGRGAAGLVCYYQDDKNYLLLRFSCAADTAAGANLLQLVAAHNGKTEILAEKPGGYLPNQWYKLRVQACDNRVQCFVDDELRLQAETSLFGQGQVGVYVEGKDGAFFDDVVCAAWEQFHDSFTNTIPGKWGVANGWVQKNGMMLHSGTNNGLCIADGDWKRYNCSVRSETRGTGGLGLVFAYNNPKQYCLLRWAGTNAKVSYRGKAQLVQVSNGVTRVLVEKPLNGGVQSRQLRASVDDGLLTGTVEGGLVLQAVAMDVTGGGVGLYAEDKAAFGTMTLTPLLARRGAHVTKEFSIMDRHPEMGAWASTQAPWVPPANGQDEWWTKGDYFGETLVTFTIPAVGSKTGTARAVIGGEPGQKKGIELTVTVTAGSKKLVLSLNASGTMLKSGEVEVTQDARIVFGRESGLVVVRVNDQPVLTVER